MLIKASSTDVEKYGEVAYRLALAPETSCYPTYADGIKTKEDFFAAAERAVKEKTSELLLFQMAGEVVGWISYDWLPADRYLQLTSFSIDHGAKQALTELLERLERSFAGYTAYFGYPADNREAISFLAEHGFRCIERDWNHSFFFDGYTPKEASPCVERITRQNFEKFRAVYHAAPETYWNAERILETIDDWTIFVYNSEDKPSATIFLTGRAGYYEIFGTEFVKGIYQEAVLRELLTASLGACKRLGVKYLTYFCGENEKAVLRELGFQCVGQYVLYIRKL